MVVLFAPNGFAVVGIVVVRLVLVVGAPNRGVEVVFVGAAPKTKGAGAEAAVVGGFVVGFAPAPKVNGAEVAVVGFVLGFAPAPKVNGAVAVALVVGFVVGFEPAPKVKGAVAVFVAGGMVDRGLALNGVGVEAPPAPKVKGAVVVGFEGTVVGLAGVEAPALKVKGAAAGLEGLLGFVATAPPAPKVKGAAVVEGATAAAVLVVLLAAALPAPLPPKTKGAEEAVVGAGAVEGLAGAAPKTNVEEGFAALAAGFSADVRLLAPFAPKAIPKGIVTADVASFVGMIGGFLPCSGLLDDEGDGAGRVAAEPPLALLKGAIEEVLSLSLLVVTAEVGFEAGRAPKVKPGVVVERTVSFAVDDDGAAAVGGAKVKVFGVSLALPSAKILERRAGGVGAVDVGMIETPEGNFFSPTDLRTSVKDLSPAVVVEGATKLKAA